MQLGSEGGLGSTWAHNDIVMWEQTTPEPNACPHHPYDAPHPPVRKQTYPPPPLRITPQPEILKVVSKVNTLVLFFASAVLIFGLCTRTGCELVLIFDSSCANVWPKQFGQLTQLCLVSGN